MLPFMERNDAPLAIINVAGLVMDGRGDRLERAMRDQLFPDSITTIAPTPPSAVREDPRASVDRTVEMVGDVMKVVRDELGSATRVVLVGRSNGGLMALAAAVETSFDGIGAVVALEAPLHPDVSVRPPWKFLPLFACASHYKGRPDLARKACDYLLEKDAGKVVMVQGVAPDGIVPLEAQKLPGKFDIVQMHDLDGDLPNDKFDRTFSHWDSSNGRGLVVRLPSNAVGVRRGISRAILYQDCLNHIFWSPEKMGHVVNVVKRVCDRI